MKFTAKNKILWSAFLLLFSFGDLALAQRGTVAQECQMSKGFKYNYFLDMQTQNVGLFGNNIEALPPTVIQNCRGSSGKYLGIGLGVAKPFIISDTANVSFDGELSEEICKLENTPKELMSHEEKKRILKAQYHMLRSCTHLEITHLEGRPIQFESQQGFCTIEKKPNGKLIAKGDFCYIKVTPDLRVAVSVAINPNCANASYLLQNNIQISDVDSFLQAFVVDEPSGIFINNQIGSAPVRVSILPTDEAMNLNKDAPEEGARFPTTFGADVHMGSMNIVSGDNGGNPATALRLSLFVDNRGDRKCNKDGICAGPGDYQIPLAAEVTLYEYKNGKRIAVDSWYAGRFLDPFVKAQWQGLYDLGQHIVDGLEMEENKTYEVVMNFYNPYEDFLMLTTRFQEFTIDYTLLNGTAGKDSIDPLASLNNIKLLPTLNNLPPVDTSNDLSVEYEKIQQYFRGFSRDSQFPPYYDDICVEGLCHKTKSTGKYLQISNKFKIQKDPESGEIKVKDLTLERTSPVMKSYQIENATLPGVVCQ